MFQYFRIIYMLIGWRNIPPGLFAFYSDSLQPWGDFTHNPDSHLYEIILNWKDQILSTYGMNFHLGVWKVKMCPSDLLDWHCNNVVYAKLWVLYIQVRLWSHQGIILLGDGETKGSDSSQEQENHGQGPIRGHTRHCHYSGTAEKDSQSKKFLSS